MLGSSDVSKRRLSSKMKRMNQIRTTRIVRIVVMMLKVSLKRRRKDVKERDLN